MLINKFDREKLWRGCILATIAHAVMAEEYPYTSNEHSWDGINYSTQDSCGCRGTITFGETYLVAVFQDYNNEEKIRECIKKGALALLHAENKFIENLAVKEALQYVLDDYGTEIAIPVITTGFWGIDNEISAKESYESIERDGAYLISNHILDYDDLIEQLTEDYEMKKDQVKLVEAIYSKKISSPNEKLYLSDREKQMLHEFYGDEIEECETTLNEINIYL